MYTRMVTILTAAMLCTMVAAQPHVEGKEQLMYEDFSDGMVRWWVEGGERTWVRRTAYI